METVSTSPEQTQKVAQNLAKNLKGGEVIALFGNLGVGKTVFVQGLARSLGIKRPVTSPTFITIRPYNIKINNKPLTFYHVDLFRTKPSDLTPLGLTEIFAPDSVVAIEWPEKIKNLPTKKRIDVKIEALDFETRRITITPPPVILPPSEAKGKDLKKAADILKKGGIVVFPTDTVYGIGCRWDFPKSVTRIYRIKGTPKTQAFPILVSSVKTVKKIAKISPAAQKLIDIYWPGALTIILNLSPSMSLRAKRSNLKVNSTKNLKIGFRMPNSKLVLFLIEKVGVPIIGTSANIHGKPAVKTSNDLDPRLTKQVDYVLEGECERGVASTIADATIPPIKILRQGAIKL